MPSDTELQAAPVPAWPNLDALPRRRPVPRSTLKPWRGLCIAGGGDEPGEGWRPGRDSHRQPLHAPATLQPHRPGRARQGFDRPRGFADGSLRTTVAQVQRLIGDRQVVVQIDPQAFDRYAVTRVPASSWCAMAPDRSPAPAWQLPRRRGLPADLRRREPGLRAGIHAAVGTRFGPAADIFPEADSGIGGR